jgi:predicted MFS family arabinose efflux permease
MAAFSLASILGVPVGLMLANWFGWQTPFAVLAGGTCVILVPAFFVLPPLREHLSRQFLNPIGQFLAVSLDGGHLRAYTLMAVLVFGMFTTVPFLATYLTANVGIQETELPYMYFCGGLATLISQPIVGWLADRFGKLLLFRIMATVTVVPLLIVTNLPRVHLGWVLAATTFFMIATSGRMVPVMALISASAQPRLRGSFMSINASVQQMAAGLAALLAGVVIYMQDDGTLANVSLVGAFAAVTTLFSVYLAGRLRPAVIHAVEIDPPRKPTPSLPSDGIIPAAPQEIVTRP